MNTSTSTTTPLAAWLDARRADVEAALERILAQHAGTGASHWPGVVHEAMRYSLLAGGKRLRPMLTLAAAEAVANLATRGERERDFSGDRVNANADEREHEARRLALPAACAIEMIHTYSLIHDDLPAMDDDSLRRGQPTSHVRFGEGMAILAGDGLLTEAFTLLAREPAGVATEVGLRKLRTIEVIAEAAGAAGMVGGQAIDLHAARPHGYEDRTPQVAPFDAGALRNMHARKTGALIRAATVAGAVMAGASRDTEAAVGAFATDLGLAFQIVDDVLDVEGTAADLGKTAGKDAAAGKPTYPALFGLDRSKQLAREAADRALAVLASAGLRGRLSDIAEWVVHRKH
jgi:geranylgeranyl diphosphate synthase, type II